MEKRKMLRVRQKRVLTGILCAVLLVSNDAFVVFHSYAAETEQDQYEIVPNSYKNNVKEGTASVTIRGVNNYGGTKIVKFSIRAKGFVWWK